MQSDTTIYYFHGVRNKIYSELEIGYVVWDIIEFCISSIVKF